MELSALGTFAKRLRSALRLGRRDFNVCLINNRAMRRLNGVFRGKRASTDVLSFPWRREGARGGAAGDPELRHFLGDVVISAQAARLNARREGHSTLNEIRWLMVHGVLHLLGYDHERDHGEMTARELALRAELGIGGEVPAPPGKTPRRPARRAAKKS